MSKVWNYSIMMSGIILLMYLAGLPTGLDWFLTKFGLQSNNPDLLNSEFYNDMVILLSALGGTAVVAGFFTRASFEYVFLAPFATATLVLYGSTFTALVSYAAAFDSWIYYGVLLIFGVLGVGYLLAMIGWVFNRE